MPENAFSRPCYLDASALVKLVVSEDGSADLRAFFDEWATFLSTSLCVGEALGALKCKYLDRKEITQKEYFEACFDIVAYIYMQQPRITIDDLDVGHFDVFHEVKDVASKYTLDFSDALQLVTIRRGAFHCFAGPKEPMLITADGDLADAARSEGMSVWEVCKEPAPELTSHWGDRGQGSAA